MKRNSQNPQIGVQHFESQLEVRRAELLQITKRMAVEGIELVPDGPQDTADSSVIHSSKEALFAESSRNRILLQLVESALRRIQNGDFGECVMCDGQIGYRRLLAVPWTQYCIRC